MTTKLFSELKLSAELLKAIDRLGFEQASPIQANAIPVLLEGKDIVGQSQTGSGKTAAFGIPAIEKIDPRQRQVQVLILCPTRELAVQVSEDLHQLAFFKRGVHALPIYGGQSYERQFYGLRQGAQIVIGTPGRVMDHMRRGTLRLDAVKLVVLDEADVMLDMGFREDIEFILQSVPAERQTVFFSATIPRPIRELIERFAKNPVTVKIEEKTLTVPTVEQVFYEVDRRFKVELLTRLIDLHDYKLGIVFCNTKRMVDDLVDHLNAQGYSADRLHGDMSQAMRDRVMNKFRKSGLQFLVATDVAARGIDVDDVQVVFNYDLPYDAEDYLHRIGRTGRVGRSGRAISFVSGRELYQIQQIERFIKTRIQRARIPTPDQVEQARASAFLDKLRSTLTGGEFKKQDHLVETLLEEGFTSTDIASALIHHLQSGDGAEGSERKAQAESYERPERGALPGHRTGRPEDSFRFREPPRSERPLHRGARESATRGRRSPEPASPQFKPPFRTPQQQESHEQKPATRPRKQALDGGVPSASPPVSSVSVQPSAQLGKLESQEKKAEALEAAPPQKHSRATPSGMTRIYINIGQEMGVAPGEIVQAVMGETGLPPQVVGTIDIRERHLFADVASEHANGIIAKLNRTTIKGHRVKVKLA